jgi:hypothetical protein
MPQTQTLRRPELAAYAVVLALLVAGLALAHVDHEFFDRRYVVEDGPIEWLTVIAFAAGAVVCLRRAFILRASRPAKFIAVTILLGLMFLFVAGEEISWGQRLFDVESGEFFEQHNAQAETNLHNIRIGEIKINKLIFSKGVAIAGALYFCVLAPLYGTRPTFAARVDAWGVPIPKLHHIIAVLAVLLIAQVLTPSPSKGELAEFGGGVLFTLIVAFPSNIGAFSRAT